MSLGSYFYETHFQRLTDDCWRHYAQEHQVYLDSLVKLSLLCIFFVQLLENQGKRAPISEIPQNSIKSGNSKGFSHDCQIRALIDHLFTNFHHINPGSKEAFHYGAFDKILPADSQIHCVTNQNWKIASENSHVRGLVFGFVQLKVGNVWKFVVCYHTCLDCVKRVKYEVSSWSK